MGIIMSLEWLLLQIGILNLSQFSLNMHSLFGESQLSIKVKTVHMFGASFRSLDTWIERGLYAGYPVRGVVALSTNH